MNPVNRRGQQIGCALLVTASILGCEDIEDALNDIEVVDDTGDAGSDIGDDAESDAGPTPPVLPERAEPATDWEAFEQLAPKFEPAGDGFYATPWPSDARTFAEDGTVDLRNFPQSNNALVQDYRAVMEHRIVGFSTMPVVYVAYDGSLEGVSIPEPAETLALDSPIQLIAVDPEHCGERVPLETSPALVGDRYTDPNTLRIAPVAGFALRPASTYALVVTRALGNDEGRSSSQPAEIAALLAGTSTNSRYNSSFAPLRDCMAAARVWPSEVSVATVFTTQDPVAETRLLIDAVNDPAQTDTPEVVAWGANESRTTATYTTWSGTLKVPIFQAGTTPYTSPSDGGGLQFGANGLPEVVRYEDAPFSIAWPRDAELPMPIMVWIDGTGANAESHIGDPPFLEALARGFAVANIQPQFHAGRGGPTANEELSTFNYLNPAAGRTNFRQQAAEVSYFARFLREVANTLDGVPDLDFDRMVYGGHSQGALVGAMLAGVDGNFRSYFLNGVGAYLAITIVERKDPFDIQQLVGSALNVGGPIDRHHLVASLAQLGGDAVDPGNYARYWRGWTERPMGNNVLMSNGNEDDTTHYTSINTITIAGDAAPMAPAGWDVDPFGVWQRSEEDAPIEANRESIDGSPLTIASYLRDGSGHFTIYDHRPVMRMGADFWLTSIDGAPPFVDSPE
jgi:hypothetical protein